MKSALGYIVVTACVLATAIVALPALNYTNVATILSLEAAICAFVLMMISLLMATRLRLFETLFGGLDRVYVAHRRIGYVILCLILAHYLITPDFNGKFIDRIWNEIAKVFGYYTFFMLAALIAISIVKGIPWTRLRLPYHVWYFTHRFIGFAFMAIAVHQYYVKKPFDQTEPIAYILNFASLIGIVSYAYTQWFSHFRKTDYAVVAVEKHAAATVVTARPEGRGLKLRAGQFVVVHARKKGLREPHPFTVSRIGADGSLTLSIKPLGDFTSRLRERIAVGDALRVEGGYGHFDFRHGHADQIWVAGGIGVTPFSAMAVELHRHPNINVTMIYAVRDTEEALYLDFFRTLDRELNNFSFSLQVSSVDGRLDGDGLRRIAHVKPSQADLWFCGPEPLRKALVRQLSKLGERPRAVRFEQFQFR